MRKTILPVLYVLLLCVALVACPTPRAPGTPRLTGMVTIDGDPSVGTTLVANINFLDGTGTPSFQWRRGTQNINNDDSPSPSHFHLRFEDIGHVISVLVIREGYSGAVMGGPTIPVVNSGFLIPPLTGTVSITGFPAVGQTLTANTDDLGGSGNISFQWMRWREEVGESAIVGANDAEYVPSPSDVGYFLFVVVSRAGNSTRVISEAVGPVTEDPPPPSVGVIIDFLGFEDRGERVLYEHESVVSFIEYEYPLRFAVTNPGDFEGIRWYHNRPRDDDGLGEDDDGIDGYYFYFVPCGSLIGLNTLTIMVVVGGRTYSRIIEVLVTP